MQVSKQFFKPLVTHLVIHSTNIYWGGFCVACFSLGKGDTIVGKTFFSHRDLIAEAIKIQMEGVLVTFLSINKILNTCNLKEKRFMLAQGLCGFSLWSSGPSAQTAWWEGMTEESCSHHGDHEAEREWRNQARTRIYSFRSCPEWPTEPGSTAKQKTFIDTLDSNYK